MGVFLAFACLFGTVGNASAETRTLKLYFIHTREKAEITYKRNGRYDQKGLQQINRFLRDWRRNEPTKMDTRLLDAVWEVYKASGARDYIHVVSAYRSPATNSMLRSRSKGVANKSQHMLGKAMDFYIPGVKLSTLRNLGLKAGAGGVGYYPKSGSPFVHFDVGNVRHWPRMSRSQLLAVFPRGDTMHVPTDGKPLPGYKQALAAYQSRQKNGGSTQLASSGRSGGFLSALFGGGADDEEDSNPALTEVASAHSPARSRRSPATAPAEAPAAAPQQPETVVAALPARNAPIPGMAPRQAAAPDASAAMLAALAPQQDPNALDPRKAVEQAIAAGAASAVAPVLDAPFKQESEIAFNVPLPTSRPDYTPASPALPDTAPMLVAAAEREAASGPTVAAALVEEAAPTVAAAAAQDGDQVAALVKSGLNPQAVSDASDTDGLATAYAAIPSARPSNGSSRSLAALAAAEVPAEPAPVVARNEVIIANGGQLSGSEGVPSQRVAMLSPDDAGNAARTLQSGVKTTGKAARPRAVDAKAETRSVAVPAQPEVARWALHHDKVAQNTEGTKAPSFAYNIVRTAPREVYTAGFQQVDHSSDANRFTGKAVQFLSVARFE